MPVIRDHAILTGRNPMPKPARAIIVPAILAAIVLTGADAAWPASCEELLLTRCEGCHYLSRVCQKLGKEGKWKWKRTMAAMVRHGAKINPAEQDQLVTCLADNSPEARAACQTPTATKPYIQPLEKMPQAGAGEKDKKQ